jgi:sugar phosphate isomerase/epimerase
MTGKQIDRRSILKGALGTAAAGALAATIRGTRAAGENRMKQHTIRFGGPVFLKSDDPEELAQAHRKLNYGAAYCPHASLDDTERIRSIESAYRKHDVVIAEVGRWCNLMEADEAKRKANMKNVTEGLVLADAVGARCCVDIAGSLNKEVWYGPHPDNLSGEFFDAAVENARKIIDAVKPQRAKFCYEMMGWALPDSADSYLQMLKAVDRPAFAVHLDPCNLVNSPRRFYNNAALINECFDKLGPHIVSCHAKDLTWDVEMNVHFREVPVGSGKVDYTVYLKRLAKLQQQPPLMLEHCANEEEYDQARKHVLEHGGKIGVEFA